MNFIGNLLWLILGGLLTAIMYFLFGLLLCITIIGAPFGVKIIKMAGLALFPFGKKVAPDPAEGCFTTIFNVLWILLGWWEIAAVHAVFGIFLCLTIVGIPFGKQHFKMAKYSLFPFGCKIS